jgi:hypothetical protein
MWYKPVMKHSHNRLDVVPVSVYVNEYRLPGAYKAWHCFDCGRKGVFPSVPDRSRPAVEIRFDEPGVLAAWRKGQPVAAR